MRRPIARGLAVFVSIASLGAGAAGGPNNSEAGKTQLKTPSRLVRGPAFKAKRRKPFQVGTASWYGEYFQGRETASGERYDMYDLTAAHPTLPLGSYVQVTNLRNGRSVILRVNDRGPVVEGRIIDVSYHAARVLGFKAQGLQKVRLDLVASNDLAMARSTRLP